MTEYESERERLAVIADLLLHFRQKSKEGKENFTYEELSQDLLDYAEDMKQHK